MGNDKSKPQAGNAAPPTNRQPAVSKTVDEASKIKATIQRLEQRREFIEKKAAQEVLNAKAKNKKGDKKGALAHLKRKKMYEKEVEKITNATFNLEQQVMGLESSSVNVDIVEAMKAGKNAMKNAQAGIDVDDVADLQDDIAELQQQQQEIDDAISAPMGSAFDDDELESELADLEAMGLEEDLSELPSVPAANPAKKNAVDALPSAPTHAVGNDDDDALRELEAEMAM